MAKKRKTQKKKQTQSFGYSAELIGILLVLIGILGFGFGTVGNLIKEFAMFLVGEWWALILIYTLVMGVLMVFRRQLPNFFSIRLVGIYIAFIVILVATHFSFIKAYEPDKIINATMESFKLRVASMSGNSGLFASGLSDHAIGGGIIGALFSWGFASLFDSTGTIIVLVALSIFAIILIFNVDFGAMFSSLKNGLDERRIEDEDGDELEEEPKKSKFKLFGGKKDKVTDEPDDEEDLEEAIPNTMKEKVNVTTPVTLSTELKQETLPVIEPTPVATNRGIYTLPSINLLDEIPKNVNKVNSNDFTKSNKIILERVLADFEIKGTVVEIHVGPAVTQYEVAVSSGTKLSRIENMDKEIALALAAKHVSIEAPIPGKSTVGIEIPNPSVSAVKIKEVLGNIPREQEKAKILVALGKDLMGRVQTTDITKMPHLLVAGSTGSGKSVCMNSIIASILMRYRPDQVKLVLVDPKKVEMSHYNGVPHLLWPVVTDPKKASTALQRIVAIMDERYDTFSETGVKKIEDYNELVEKKKDKDPSIQMEKMPYIVVIIDELADLMMVASKEVEASIQRITQLARAAGIHLIVATQRPSTNVITGVIKANIPSRISFAVASFVDSRTILDRSGAEKLLGKGDMLFMPIGENTPLRIQGCFITDDEVRRVIEYVCGQQIASYDNTLNQAIEMEHNPVSGDKESFDDPLYNEILEFAMETGKISASLIQRRFRLGYNRAARIIDLLEERGIIGPQNGSKPREVLTGGSGEEEN